MNDEEKVRRSLAALADSDAEVPAADLVYWRAQARLVVEETNRKNFVLARPLRVFQMVIGGGAIAGALGLAFSPLGILGVASLLAMLTVGAFLIAEAAQVA